jgi:collagen type III alpha
MQEDLEEAEHQHQHQQQEQQQQLQQQQQQQRLRSASLPPLPYIDSLRLGEAAAAAAAVARNTNMHCRPTRLPSPLAGSATPASPHPPPAPSNQRFMYNSNGVDIMRTAAWLTSPVGSAGALTPMHGNSSSSSSSGVGPMNLPVLVHPGAFGGASSSYSSSYSNSYINNNNTNKSAQSTPRSCCSGVYRPPSSEQMQWLSCMRALEEPGGTGERA